MFPRYNTIKVDDDAITKDEWDEHFGKHFRYCIAKRSLIEQRSFLSPPDKEAIWNDFRGDDNEVTEKELADGLPKYLQNVKKADGSSIDVRSMAECMFTRYNTINEDSVITKDEFDEHFGQHFRYCVEKAE